MRWLAFAFQAAITVCVSIAMALLLGARVYLALAVIVAVLIAGLFVWRAIRTVLDSDGESPMWFIFSLLLAAMLGALWPMGPLAFAWGRTKASVDGLADDEAA